MSLTFSMKKINRMQLWVVITLTVVLLTPYLTSIYYDHLRDSSGSTYANMERMLTKHANDKQLSNAIFMATDDWVLSSSEVQSIMKMHFETYGTFEAVPIVILDREVGDYDKEKFIKLIEYKKINSGWNDRG